MECAAGGRAGICCEAGQGRHCVASVVQKCKSACGLCKGAKVDAGFRLRVAAPGCGWQEFKTQRETGDRMIGWGPRVGR